MRVTGGVHRSRRLRTPRAGVRPTSDRVREALFARLAPLEGLRVLDLFAGAGTLGIEALSRGAGAAVFVDRAAPAVAAVRENLAALDLASVSRVVRDEVGRALGRLGRAGERFDLVFLDPPYAGGALASALADLVASRVLAPDATVVVEHGRRHPLPPVPGLALRDERRYGDTLISRLAPAPEDRGPGGGAAPGGSRSR